MFKQRYNMIDQSIITTLEQCSRDKPAYLSYLNNFDILYDIEVVRTLHEMMRLQKESSEAMMNLLYQKHEYLKTLTFSTKICVEKHISNNDIIDYYVAPLITPNIPDGEKLTFIKPGKWFKKEEEDKALEFAKSLQLKYGGEILKTIM
jgi:hypothetical protein